MELEDNCAVINFAKVDPLAALGQIFDTIKPASELSDGKTDITNPMDLANFYQ